MPRKHHKSDSGQSWKLWIIRLLAVIAISISSYLAIVTFNNSGPAGCGDAASSLGCDEVLGTRWSSWFGIPVSVFAVLTYLLVFYYSFRVTNHRSGRTFFRMFGFVAGLAAVWFMFLQFFVLEKFCPYCIAVHVCGLTIAGLILSCGSFSKLKFNDGGFTWVTRPIAYAVIGLIVLIGGQFAYAPAEMLITDLSDQNSTETVDAELERDVEVADSNLSSTDSTAPLQNDSELLVVDTQTEAQDLDFTGDAIFDPAERGSDYDPSATGDQPPSAVDPRKKVAGETAINPPVSADSTPRDVRQQHSPNNKRDVRIERVGPVPVNVGESILLGDPSAEEIVVEMVDYTCPKCRKAHGQLERFKQVSAEPFAILLLLVPINADCNPHIRMTHPKNIQSCRYTKLAFVVWEMNPDAFPAFHSWMMQGEAPPDIDSAKKYVEKVLPDADLNELMNREDLPGKIRANTDIYLQTGKGKLPRIYINENSILGVPSDERQMFSVLKNLLALQ